MRSSRGIIRPLTAFKVDNGPGGKEQFNLYDGLQQCRVASANLCRCQGCGNSNLWPETEKGQRNAGPSHRKVSRLIRLTTQESGDVDPFLFGIDDSLIGDCALNGLLDRARRDGARHRWLTPFGHAMRLFGMTRHAVDQSAQAEPCLMRLGLRLRLGRGGRARYIFLDRFAQRASTSGRALLANCGWLATVSWAG